MASLFRQLYVLERIDTENAIRYVCYEDLATGKFCVSIGEKLTFPAGNNPTDWFLTQQIAHFMAEGCKGWFDSLAEAIEDFAPVVR